jgi:hypothetical protein
MSPSENDNVTRWTRQIQDEIADNSALREGLHDEEAIPLVDWGAAQAEVIGARLAAPDAPELTKDQVAEIAYSLTRLMTHITWVVVFRDKKDAAWLTRTFHKINDLSCELHGPDAPALSDDEIAAWLAGHEQHSSGELIQNLIARLTPTPAPESPDQIPLPSTLEPPGPTPLSEQVTQLAPNETAPAGLAGQMAHLSPEQPDIPELLHPKSSSPAANGEKNDQT